MAIQVDDAATAGIRAALATAQGLTTEIHGAVVSAQGTAIWTGQAANAFAGSVETWLAEFNNLRSALSDLETAMGGYQTDTEEAETTTRSLGEGWALPV